jgi:ribokinase
MNKIVVLGSSNTDMIVKVPRIPAPGETILGGTFLQAAGGKGANQAVAAARAGGAVTFVANVGNDALGRQAVEGFMADGIHTDFIFTDPDQPSGVALIFVSEEGENSIAVASGANGTLLPRHVEQARPVIEAADILLMQLETPLETVEAAAKIAGKAGVRTILNPAPAQTLPLSLIGELDMITPNETEAEMLTGIAVTDEDSAAKAATKLLSQGLNHVLITLGSKGAFLMNEQEKAMIPGFRVQAMDTTAAGDTFNGVLAVGLASGKDLHEAIRFAHAAAALSVTRMGAQPSVPNLEEINRFLIQNSE